MINTFIFDLDDLMVHSSPAHFEAYEHALKSFGIKSFKIPDSLRQKIYGMRIKEIMELFAGYFKMNIDVDDLTKKRNQYFMELVQKGIEPMPGLEVVIDNVKKWGFKRAVASSGVREYVDEILKQFKLTNFFGAVVTGDDIKNPKPAPDAFLLAASKIGSDPSECAVLEDSTNGLIAAKRAGMLAIGVENSLTKADQDLSVADIVVKRLDEITLEMVRNTR